jgi:prepilin-type N-terminal cleavage/methylation domain-containing protein/prepilin-type processing-associated H-X9-DG protein
MPSRQILPPGSRFSRSGFTLVELLVVVFIIGILVGLLLPAVNAARESGRRTQCTNNISQIMTAMISYETAFRSFPPGRIGCDLYSGAGAPCSSPEGVQTVGTSAFLAILPQLDSTPLYSSLTASASSGVYPAKNDASTTYWGSASTALKNALMTRPPVFVCPSDSAKPTCNLLSPPAATGSYALVLGSLGANQVLDLVSGKVVSGPADELHQKYYNNGPFVYLQPRRSADVRDGLSNTVFIGETTDGDSAASMNSWPVSVAYLSNLRSTNNPLNSQPGSGTQVTISNSGLSGLPSSATGAFGSHHPAGANFAFGDGHVRYIGNGINNYNGAGNDLRLYQALSTIAGAEPIDEKAMEALP